MVLHKATECGVIEGVKIERQGKIALVQYQHNALFGGVWKEDDQSQSFDPFARLLALWIGNVNKWHQFWELKLSIKYLSLSFSDGALTLAD